MTHGLLKVYLAACLLAPSAALTAQTQPPLKGSVPQTFSGALFDAAESACSVEVKGSATPGTCPVSVCTVRFGIRLPDGKLYRLDDGGNEKAMNALRKSKKGSGNVHAYWRTGKTSRPVTAKVAGTLTSEVLNVETITID